MLLEGYSSTETEDDDRGETGASPRPMFREPFRHIDSPVDSFEEFYVIHLWIILLDSTGHMTQIDTRYTVVVKIITTPGSVWRYALLTFVTTLGKLVCDTKYAACGEGWPRCKGAERVYMWAGRLRTIEKLSGQDRSPLIWNIRILLGRRIWTSRCILDTVWR